MTPKDIECPSCREPAGRYCGVIDIEHGFAESRVRSRHVYCAERVDAAFEVLSTAITVDAASACTCDLASRAIGGHELTCPLWTSQGRK